MLETIFIFKNMKNISVFFDGKRNLPTIAVIAAKTQQLKRPILQAILHKKVNIKVFIKVG